MANKISRENLMYLEQKLGRRLDERIMVRMSVEELSKVVEGVRVEERAKKMPSEFTKIVDVLFNGRAA